MWFYLIFTVVLLGNPIPIEHRFDVRGSHAEQMCNVLREGLAGVGLSIMSENPNTLVRVSECVMGGGDEV